MQQWIGGWGYRVTDFSLFPLCVENETQRIIVLHNMMAHHIRIKFSNQYGRTPLPINHATIVKDGQTVAIYLEREIAGFAIHLLQRK